MSTQDIQIIDPFLDAQIQHLATKDPKLYSALTNRKTITVDLRDLMGDVVVKSLRTAIIGQRVEIDGINGVRIFDSLNNVNTQLNGTALIIRTAVTGQRLEIDPINGLRIFSAGGLQSQFLGATVTLPASVITTTNLVDAAVTDLKIAAAAVTNAKVAVDAIDTVNIINNAITTTKIINDAVTNVKLATDSVTTTKIADDSITTPKLVALSVTAAKIAANTITAGQIAAGTITATEIAALTITAGNIAADAIIAVKIQAGAIIAGKLATDSVATANLIAGSVTAVKINVSQLSAISADVGTLTAGSLIGLTIKTASGTGQRIELDSSNGVRVYNSSNVLKAQLSQNGGLGPNSTSFFTVDDGYITNLQSPAIYCDGTLIAENITNVGTGRDNRIDVNGVDGITGFTGHFIAGINGTDRISVGSSGLAVTGQITSTDRIIIANGKKLYFNNTSGEFLSQGTLSLTASNSGIDLSNGTTIIRVASDGHLKLTSQNNVTELVGDLQVSGNLSCSSISTTFGGFTGSGAYTNFTFSDGICTAAS